MTFRFFVVTVLAVTMLLGSGCARDASGPIPAPRTVEAAAEAAVLALRDKDFAALATLVHPDVGVRFSPYAHVETQQDRVYNADALTTAWADRSVYTWGSFDGSGAPIAYTFSQYYERFIFDQDFTKAQDIRTESYMGTGNIIDNWQEAYPNGRMVEYYFPGFDPQFGGMDWSSLRLVFEQKDHAWYLVGVMHGEWTI